MCRKSVAVTSAMAIPRLQNGDEMMAPQNISLSLTSLERMVAGSNVQQRESYVMATVMKVLSRGGVFIGII